MVRVNIKKTQRIVTACQSTRLSVFVCFCCCCRQMNVVWLQFISVTMYFVLSISQVWRIFYVVLMCLCHQKCPCHYNTSRRHDLVIFIEYRILTNRQTQRHSLFAKKERELGLRWIFAFNWEHVNVIATIRATPTIFHWIRRWKHLLYRRIAYQTGKYTTIDHCAYWIPPFFSFSSGFEAIMCHKYMQYIEVVVQYSAGGL